MKQVWMSAMFMVCVGAAAAYADDSASSPDAAVSTSETRRAAFHVAFAACLSENNLSRPQPGARPSDADREVIHACLKSKGFNRPPGPPPPERQAASDDSSSQ